MPRDVVDRLNAALEGRYRIRRELGEGGMATVYLAEDLKHDRQVALKVLKPELAAVLGGERFLQEIRVTANLQHPHILPLHDSGSADTYLYYVMPFVEGETLRDRLAREKQLPVEEALRIAVAVGSALDYAHRRNVIHRDIKPANILLQDGQPVVADFGIALAVNAAGGARLTETGLSIGTPHYMSPEQASGDRELDGRSDVYALSAVLYEMLTGEPPFQGATAQSVLARILTEKPRPVQEVRDATPAHVAAAVRRGLAKLPADRFASAGAFVEELRRADVAPELPTVPAGRTSRASTTGRRSSLQAFAGAALALLAGVLAGRMLVPDPDPSVMRVTLSFAGHPEIISVGDESGRGASATVSPDGRTVVFVGNTRDGRRLYRRDLASFGATPIPGTEGGFEPRFTPDGRRIVFYRGAEEPWTLSVLPLEGGIPIRFPGFWLTPDVGLDGNIYSTWGPGVLARVPVQGGDREELAEPDSGFVYLMPSLLPDRKTVLVTHMPDAVLPAPWITGEADPRATLRLVDLETGQAEELMPGMFGAFTPPDVLTFLSPNGPVWIPFDPGSRTVEGSPRPHLADASGYDLVMSPSGHVVYRPRFESGDQLVRVDRNGGERGRVGPVAEIGSAVISPDGARVVASQGQPVDLWVYDLEGDQAPLRLTFGDGDYDQPAWSGDGRSVWLTNGNGAASDLYRVAADGTGTPALIRDADVGVFFPVTVPEGDWVVFYEARTETGRDILALRQDRPDEVVEVVATPASERTPALSPDERFLAYVSDGTGTDEVYVTRFPSGEGRWLVSSGGGWEPLWSPDGSVLYFRTHGAYVAAEVSTDPGFRVLRTRELFPSGRFATSTNVRLWDVAPDGESFVMIRLNPAPPELRLVLNAVTELRQGR